MKLCLSIFLAFLALSPFQSRAASNDDCEWAVLRAQRDCEDIQDGFRQFRCEMRALAAEGCSYKQWGSMCANEKGKIDCTFTSLRAQRQCSTTSERRQKQCELTILNSCGCLPISK